MSKQSQGKKVGRNKKVMEAYKNGQKREINKYLRAVRTLKKHPNDITAYEAFKRYEQFVPKRLKTTREIKEPVRG